MKKTVRLISTLLVMAFLFSVITCAPYTVSAAEVDTHSVSVAKTGNTDTDDISTAVAEKEKAPMQAKAKAEDEKLVLSVPVEDEDPEPDPDKKRISFEDYDSVLDRIDSFISSGSSVSSTNDEPDEEDISDIQNDKQSMIVPVGAATDDGFSYTITEEKVTITNYTGSTTDVVIPSEIEGYPVVSIGNSAFSNDNVLKEVELPDSLVTVGDYAFSSCKSLESITIPENVEKIGIDAFQWCTALKEVNFNAINCTQMGTYRTWNSYKYNEQSFYGCSALETVTFGEEVTTVPAYAFYGCSGLKEAYIPESVESIGQYAFYNCSDMVIVCEPDSFAEQYAIDNNYDYRYFSYTGKMLITADSSFEGCTVRVMNKRGSTSRVINGGMVMVSGLDNTATYWIALYNPQGRLIFRKENITFEDENAIVRLDKTDLYKYIVVVTDENGEAVNDYSVTWRVNGALDPESCENTVTNLNTGDHVICGIQLGETLKKIYEEPSAIVETVDNEDKTITVKLQRAPTESIIIKVVDNNDNTIADTELSIVQQINKKVNLAESFVTDESGTLTVELRTVETTIKAKNSSYFAATWTGVIDGSEIVIVMNDASGAKFAPTIKPTYNEGTVRATAQEIDLNTVSFRIYNQTKKQAIETFTYNNGNITVPYESIETGDSLEFTAVDNNGVFADGKATVVYDRYYTQFDLPMIEKGVFSVAYTTPNRNNMALIFDANGNRVASLDLNATSMSDQLTAGAYSVVFIGYAASLFRVATYDMLLSYGLIENEHFVKKQVVVTDGSVAMVNDVEIPRFNESSILYIDGDNSYVSISPQSIGTGRRATLTVSYSVKEQYADSIAAKSVEVVLPDGVKAYSSIRVNSF